MSTNNERTAKLKVGMRTGSRMTQVKRKTEESRLLGGGVALVAAAGLPGVELRQGTLRNSLQHLLGEDPEQLPADVQRLVHGPVVVWT